jgi:hypothetical protein
MKEIKYIILYLVPVSKFQQVTVPVPLVKKVMVLPVPVLVPQHCLVHEVEDGLQVPVGDTLQVEQRMLVRVSSQDVPGEKKKKKQ